ncbi:MAG TPA: NAD-dependent epimerase/dehydratase family protein [Mycobacteriales bacterium]|nr:NAD-dependent epimerase/dehydratase family protein [Mycobacteriales bacterium]
MRILVVGGTRLVGRHIAQTALDRGHAVTLFNRGRTDPGAFPDATHLVGDRNKDLSALSEGTWDATIDVSAYTSKQVHTLLEALGDRAGQLTFISTISVYGANVPNRGFTESAPLLEPDYGDVPGLENYGELKVACEKTAMMESPRAVLIIRPGYVIGPYDETGRFNHWVKAVADGRPFTGPDREQPLQVVDGRDLAAFTIDAVERGRAGEFNICAPQQPPTFAQVLDTIAAALDVPLPEVTWTTSDDSLPLSAPREWWPKMHADVSKAVNAGFTWRPLAQSVRDIADYAGIKT